MDGVIFVIFGASGDLAVRKLIPAIFELYTGKYLPENFAVLGVSRSKYTDAAFRKKVFYDSEFIKLDSKEKKAHKDFADRLSYTPVQTKEVADYAKVKKQLKNYLTITSKQ